MNKKKQYSNSVTMKDEINKSDAKTIEKFKKVDSVSKNENNYIIITREEILRKRKQRNEAKKQEKAREREAKLLEDKIFKKSDKIKTLGNEEFKRYQSKQQQTIQQHSLKNKKIESFNILDFLIIKNTIKKKDRFLNNNKKQELNLKKNNCGKKHENNVKVIRSRLKKAIVKARKARKEEIFTEDKISSIVPYTEDSKNLKSNDSDSTSEKLDIINNVNTFDTEIENSLEKNVSLIQNKIEKLKIIDVNTTVDLKANIHSRKFRSYCDNLTSPILRNLTENLIRKIHGFQKRAYQKNEIKAKAHRRYVMGFKETERGLATNKIKLVIIAPDCEKCDTSDGIDETIERIKLKCNENEIPYLFSMRGRQIAYCLFIKVPIHCLGIISYDGAQDIYNELVSNLIIERENYSKSINGKKLDSDGDIQKN